MELGLKKPKISFSYRDNDSGSTERNIKKEQSNKSHMVMLDQTRNKSISNANKKTNEINKNYNNEKSANIDQKKYVIIIKIKKTKI